MNETIATLVRIMDEERGGNIELQREVGSLKFAVGQERDKFEAELEANRELRNDIRQLYHQQSIRDERIKELEQQQNRHLDFFQSEERMREAVERLAFEFLNTRVNEIRNELGAAFSYIRVITEVREHLGLNLKVSKDLVDSWRALKEGLCPNCQKGQDHSLISHFPNGGCQVKFCQCREW